ncbi:hypothetical protein SAMD00019534_087880 [Acytostelium subglobosum LB1]|uniref:hypothetical protein n=1 Tax=Acytostelium subglobosum LB1 TaxID=1410327 RepID=UPI000644D74F|nr:hypothetical protein SAMD00019534_087880 [Acytostelium subglobosum LB1]GAM25613.1 hypothetical protein SAMD00019534_087880 [Acytostelium subglobosum LB1]|eukprot:XP_012751599.1 hypothetical protein SAMD00019534_087880 [Acytostelium subglobosum LB1]
MQGRGRGRGRGSTGSSKGGNDNDNSPSIDNDNDNMNIDSTESAPTTETTETTTETTTTKTAVPTQQELDELRRRIESQIGKQHAKLATQQQRQQQQQQQQLDDDSPDDERENISDEVKNYFDLSVKKSMNPSAYIRKKYATKLPEYSKAPKKNIPTNVYYGINFPGNVVNPDRAVEMVGGLNSIAKVFKSTEQQYLHLKYRPDYLNTRAAFGDRVPTCHMLLRVRPTPAQDTGAPASFESDIIAVVPSTIEFNGMADFQYTVREKQTDDLAGSFAGETPKDMRDEELNVIPSIFSRVDKPQPYHFRTNPLATFDPDTRTFSTRKSTYTIHNPFSIRFEDGEVPIVGRPVPQGLMNDKVCRESHAILVELLKERPSWLSIVLKDHYQKRGGHLKFFIRLLGTISYLFSNGPFRLTYCRLGYDPRQSPASRMYQVFECRSDKIDVSAPAPTPWRHRKNFETPRRGFKAKMNTFTHQGPEAQSQTEGYIPPRYDYTYTEKPLKGSYYFQLCDLGDEKMKQYINNHPLSPICVKQFGWFNKDDWVCIQQQLKLKHNMTLSTKAKKLKPVFYGDNANNGNNNNNNNNNGNNNNDMDEYGMMGDSNYYDDNADNDEAFDEDFRPMGQNLMFQLQQAARMDTGGEDEAYELLDQDDDDDEDDGEGLGYSEDDDDFEDDNEDDYDEDDEFESQQQSRTQPK